MPAKRSNSKTMHRAGELRKEPTPAERKLWAYLRGDNLQGINFRRQHALGNYIVDFVSIKRKLIIELDGTPFGRNTWSRKNMTPNEPNSCNPWAIQSFDFGITRS